MLFCTFLALCFLEQAFAFRLESAGIGRRNTLLMAAAGKKKVLLELLRLCNAFISK